MTIIIITILTMTISILAIYLSLFDSAEWLREKIGLYVDRDLIKVFTPFLYIPIFNIFALFLIILLSASETITQNSKW